ncbi:MAG: LytR C-terminal domain-containing protein [Solirubrobacterales bacterium]|nr:LytR C-terminal domain-containing protein [Solirubrobacterales bacterium]
MNLLKEIGAILGFVAFGGLAVLSFLTFQQARHLRRLRDWAGRSPERALAEAERVAEVAGEATIAREGGHEGLPEEEDRGPGRMARLRGELAYRWEELDRRSPVDAKFLVAGILAVIIGVGIVTSGFGLLGGDTAPSTDVEATTGSSSSGKEKEPPPVKVAVLNGTTPEGGVGVPGIADAASKFVEDAGYKVGNVDNAPFSTTSVVMYAEGADSDANDLAAALEDTLGTTDVTPITPEVADVAGRADIALIIGQDDQGIS